MVVEILIYAMSTGLILKGMWWFYIKFIIKKYPLKNLLDINRAFNALAQRYNELSEGHNNFRENEEEMIRIIDKQNKNIKRMNETIKKLNTRIKQLEPND